MSLNRRTFLSLPFVAAVAGWFGYKPKKPFDDLWAAVDRCYSKRVGLTELMYGLNYKQWRESLPTESTHDLAADVEAWQEKHST